MNSCIVTAEIYDSPQLRHTPDGLEVTEMIVHISGLRPDDPSHPLKVVGWGNLAKEIHQNYHPGDRVILEGRLGMNTFETPQGYKEKRAELTLQRIHNIGSGVPSPARTTVAAPPPSAPYRSPEYETTPAAPTPSFTATPEPTYQPTTFDRPAYTTTSVTEAEPDPDDIPFVRPVHCHTSLVNELWDSYEVAVSSPWEGTKQIKP
jgi:single-strand DNA-binding protein